MSRETAAEPTFGYLVHDLNDAAVARRARLFAEGGARVKIGGFRRRDMPDSLAGADSVADLGVTQDMRMAQRIRAVAGNLLRPQRARGVVAESDVIVARNLEMLAIAAWTRRRGQRLVYECLDLHRLLLSDSRAGSILRAIERRLLAKVAMIITSSPAYVDRYFRERQGYRGLVLLVENKVPLDAPLALPPATGPDPRPWRIGWFGIIRCRKSLAMLAAMSVAAAGRVEILIAGRPNRTELPEFDEIIAATPGLSFAGAYRLDQLPALYAAVDFAWAVDFYEEGLNSQWLLPNRLYESLAAGVPPLALADVEVGRWLDQAGVGHTFASLDSEVLQFLSTLDGTTYTAMRDAVAKLPHERTRFVSGESARIVRAMLDADRPE